MHGLVHRLQPFGRGDASLATASTPTILLGQFVLLPLYLWTFMGQTFAEIFEAGPLVRVFVLLILVPHACSSGAAHSFDMLREHLVDE